MSIKPTGMVTFLFTDIEGSTGLAQKFPDKYNSILQKHDSILKKTIESNNGFVFKKIGDSFCSSFNNCKDAVNTSITVQKKLLREFDGTIKLKVRMGIHAGEAEYIDNDYSGYITLTRTQRVMSVANGGQILFTKEAFEKAKNHFSFRDLGERKLKDLIFPEHVYQLIAEGLLTDFPPLKTLDLRLNNLPVQLTSFVGRDEEIKKLKKLLNRTHLLTLTGSGGSGKTRLALRIATDQIDEFSNGVWLVELAPLRDPNLLAHSISKIFDIKEEPKTLLDDSLIKHLKDKELLIVLDNCEHLIRQSAELTEKLLTNCPKLKIIATSRESLKCSGEQSYSVPSLAVPDPDKAIPFEKMKQYESVRLFIERALEVNPSFQINDKNAVTITRICSQLDGIPLAIELAAARTKALSVEKINERLSQRFTLLTEGKRTALPRQQTLKAMIDWSYNLLTKSEKTLFNRISVFNGGWNLEAAEAICIDKFLKQEKVLNTLSHLIDKSLVIYDKDTERYGIQETIKQYGQESLVKAEKMKIKQSHFNYFFQLAEKINPELYGPLQNESLEKLETESSNFQTALLFSLEEKLYEEGIRLTILLGKYWKIRGYITEGKRWVKEFLQRKIPAAEKANANKLAGSLEWLSGELSSSKNFHEKSLAIYKHLKDKKGIASSLGNLGLIEFQKGNYEKARTLTEESLQLYKYLKDEYNSAASLLNLGCIFMLPGQYERAKSAFDSSIRIFRKHGDRHGIALCLGNLGTLSNYLGEYTKAKLLIEESIALNRELGNKHDLALSLNSLGFVELRLGEYERSVSLHKESLKLRFEIRNKLGMVTSLIGISEFRYLKHAKDTAVILGAIKSAIRSIEGEMDPQVNCIYETTYSALKNKLGQKTFLKYFKEGEALTIEQTALSIINY